MSVRIVLRELQRIRRRVDDTHIHSAGLVLERAAVCARHPHHVSERSKDYIRISSHRESVVDSSHGEHADWTARPVHKLDVLGKEIFQAEAVYRMRVSSAHLHEAVVPGWIREAADLVGGLRDYAGLAKFIDKFHKFMG